ncbi:hypothetical protein B0H13DRAFT_1851539 [Mycena leptocephala]|nr:hypothetical protein B0H13DRAFT_1851539 [Mycena leptocephala]
MKGLSSPPSLQCFHYCQLLLCTPAPLVPISWTIVWLAPAPGCLFIPLAHASASTPPRRAHNHPPPMRGPRGGYPGELRTDAYAFYGLQYSIYTVEVKYVHKNPKKRAVSGCKKARMAPPRAARRRRPAGMSPEGEHG